MHGGADTRRERVEHELHRQDGPEHAHLSADQSQPSAAPLHHKEGERRAQQPHHAARRAQQQDRLCDRGRQQEHSDPVGAEGGGQVDHQQRPGAPGALDVAAQQPEADEVHHEMHCAEVQKACGEHTPGFARHQRQRQHEGAPASDRVGRRAAVQQLGQIGAGVDGHQRPGEHVAVPSGTGQGARVAGHVVGLLPQRGEQGGIAASSFPVGEGRQRRPQPGLRCAAQRGVAARGHRLQQGAGFDRAPRTLQRYRSPALAHRRTPVTQRPVQQLSDPLRLSGVGHAEDQHHGPQGLGLRTLQGLAGLLQQEVGGARLAERL